MSAWTEIQQGLRGTRLAIYDDLLHGRTVDVHAPAVQNVLGWLVFNRLVWQDEGQLKARLPARAREIYLRDGPARDAGQQINPPALEKSHGATSLPERGATPAAASPGLEGDAPGDNGPAHPAPTARPRVHNYQAELFGLG